MHVVGFLSATAALATLAGCPDSLHLDPVGTTGSGGGSGGGGTTTTATGMGGDTSGPGGGGAAPSGCESNVDCAYPEPVCDTSSGECVECLELADCGGKAGTVCSKGACACPIAAESFCPALGNKAARCVDLATSSADCGSCGHACFGACAMSKCSDPWEPTSDFGAPSGRSRHVAVLATIDAMDRRMIVWGGLAGGGATDTGGMYDLATGKWTPTSVVNAPSARQNATAVWDDVKKVMVVWGGQGQGGALASGGLFDPKKNTWTTMSVTAVPAARWGHTAIWTGSKMIVWGGTDGGDQLADGGQYDPATNTWLGDVGTFLTKRTDHTAIYTGNTMVIWGGFGNDGVNNNVYLGDGASYDSQGNWNLLSSASQPTARGRHTAVWTGNPGLAMLVWGGFDGNDALGDGAKFSGGGWLAMNNPSPEPRHGHTAVWIAKASPQISEMIIWGGEGDAGYLNNGYSFDETTLNWKGPLPTAPTARARHTAIVDGTRMIIWGGVGNNGPTNTGAIFDSSFAN